MLTETQREILTAAARGVPVADIARTHHCKPADVTAMLTALGATNQDQARELLSRDRVAKAVATLAKAPAPEAAPPPALVGSTVEELLDVGESHPQPRVRSIALRARTLVDTLRTLIEEEQRADLAKARIAELESQLAAARAELHGRTPTPRRGDPKEIRAWARTAQVDCPGRGAIPAKVEAAFWEAHKTS